MEEVRATLARLQAVLEAGAKELERLKDALEETVKTLHDMQVIQARQQLILDEHIRRTEANEKMLELMREQMVSKRTVNAIWGFVGASVGLIGTLVGLFK